MFNSHMLLSKKGPLGTVWFAAHCHKSLKKDPVKQTNIISCVDKILLDEVPVLAYRILAFLLLGVVRIYSKKVEYLFDDCHDVVAKLNDFNVGKRKGVSIGGIRTPRYTITFPKRFELDAFDLEFMECQDVSNGNVGSYEDITLDGLRKEGNTVDNLDEDHHEENISFSEAHSSVYTPVRDVFSPHLVHEQLVVNQSHNMRNSVASMEIFCGTEFFLEDRLDPLEMDAAENEWGHDRLSDKEHEMEKEQMEYPMTKWNSQEEESLNLSRSFYENEALDEEHTRLQEITVLDSRRCRKIEEYSTSIAFNVTSDSKDPGGAATPQIMAIHTPAPKESVKVLKKRKCSFDKTMAVSNKIFKQWIHDASNLIRKRKNVPQTVLHAWRAHKLSNLPRTFLDHLFSGISLDLRSLECKKILLTMPFEDVEIFASQDEARSSITPKSREQTPIAPTTTVTHSASLRVQESKGIFDILEPSRSNNGTPEEVYSLSEDLELNITPMDEEIDSSEGTGQTGKEKNVLSERTRTIARNLYGNFIRRKRCNEDAVVKLSQFVEGKTKKESARLFYEALILKTWNCIDVRQENPYDDISLLETPLLRQLFEPEVVALL